MTLPTSVSEFEKRADAWLLARGSAVLAPTNPYEVIRFVGTSGTAIIYRNEANRLTNWHNGADAAFKAYLSGNSNWRAVERQKKPGRLGERKRTVLSIVARDGWSCVYCGHMTTLETATVEEIVARTHGGPQHLANQALAHRECNQAASHLSAREKIEMAIRLRAQPCAESGKP